MPFNGSGTFTRNYSWVNDANNGIDIDATRMDTDTNDITGNGLSNCITRDGQSVPTANLPMGNFRHTGITSGTARTQYASIAQLQDGGTLFGGTSSGTNTITFNLTPAITAYVAGQIYSFIAGNACTGASTLNINGVGAVAITKFGTTPIVANDILATGICFVEYDGTEFQLLNPANNTPGTNSVTNSQLAQMATKTIKSNITGGTANAADNTVTAVLDTIASTQGDLLYRDSSAWLALAPGTAGNILKSGGSAANPSWETVAAALESIGSTQGQVMYRSGSAWVPLSPGSSGQFLQTQGESANPQWGSVIASPITKSFLSAGQTVSTAGSLTISHSMGTIPKILYCYLQCVTANSGYTGGEMVGIAPNTSQGGTSRGYSIWPDSTNINVIFGNDANIFYIFNKTTGGITPITPSDWQFYVQAYA